MSDSFWVRENWFNEIQNGLELKHIYIYRFIDVCVCVCFVLVCAQKKRIMFLNIKFIYQQIGCHSHWKWTLVNNKCNFKYNTEIVIILIEPFFVLFCFILMQLLIWTHACTHICCVTQIFIEIQKYGYTESILMFSTCFNWHHDCNELFQLLFSICTCAFMFTFMNELCKHF